MKPQLTKEAFAEWCEKQPADARYDYTSCSECACAQYAHSLGILGEDWIDQDDDRFWWKANQAAAGSLGSPDYTFGALARRLRA